MVYQMMLNCQTVGMAAGVWYDMYAVYQTSKQKGLASYDVASLTQLKAKLKTNAENKISLAS